LCFGVFLSTKRRVRASFETAPSGTGQRAANSSCVRRGWIRNARAFGRGLRRARSAAGCRGRTGRWPWCRLRTLGAVRPWSAAGGQPRVFGKEGISRQEDDDETTALIPRSRAAASRMTAMRANPRPSRRPCGPPQDEGLGHRPSVVHPL
jgi:hypothetical protein